MNDKVVVSLKNSIDFSILNDGKYRKLVFDHLLESDISEDNALKIFENANRILRNCPNPKSDKFGKTGIVIGKVQSGKTSNFISLISLSFDNGYSLAVVLGGNKKNLVDQNADRIKEYFCKSNGDVVVLSTEGNAELLKKEVIEQFLDSNKRVIIVGLKHQKHIKMIAELFNDSYLSNVPVIIIDDEGDQATLNTQVKKNKQSTIYKSILSLKSVLKTHCFLSVTATPQANILIDTIDILSPDFCVLTSPGDGYCGLETFHGANTNEYLRVINENECDLYEGTQIPKSFEKAFAAFFVGGALRRYRGDYKNHALLIHPSQKKEDHKIVVEKVDRLRQKWYQIAKLVLKGYQDITYPPLRNKLVDAYKDFKKYSVTIPEFDDIEKDILQIITECSPALLCNSDMDATENSKMFKYNIFVGGNMVERGLTIKGLAVTYITRRAKGTSNVDNTEQRARWFGYKEAYLDVCRIFTTETIKKDFEKIYEHDEDLWATIERHMAKGLPFKDMPRIFKLSSDVLRLTRNNVATSERYSFSEWTIQGYIHLNKDEAEYNQKIINTYRENNSGLIEQFEINGIKNDKYKIIKNVNYENVYNDILSKYKYPNESNLNNSFIYKIDEAFKKLDLHPIVDVVFIRDNELYGERNISIDGKINQLFQGRAYKVTDNSYPGDLNLPNEHPDNIQLQIHKIKPNNMELDYVNYVIALFLPEVCTKKMADLVGRK